MGDATNDENDDPLSDLADRVGRRRAERTESEENGAPEASPFESMAVESVDSETLWTELVDDHPATAGVAAEAEAVEGASGDLEHVVPKRSFCQSCPHFAVPPAFACTRGGTEIVEVADADRFRVRNCPVVRGSDPDERR
ncbi:hypothetical protein C474_05915 [Halogeometricum pallidum JCM 14848]|uniref:DUF8135 domain-containing protein n=1 Tax=Halogeometricum pallidum JCM 14848 TaxID=1227487 RepID=M0DBA6_HALPD|nr:hypothetical protein [Halogeometricum pallidum]ELZ32785.1 hypothetical protein C474_05915 [Halogeometricum pallidum JCM 14848]